MRVRKSPEERKRQILEVSFELFMENGYDNTSVNTIVEEVGVSKGAFYHYFQSKDDLLESIARHWVDRAIEEIERIAAEPDLSAVEKINRVIAGLLDYRSSFQSYGRQLYNLFNHENAPFMDRVRQYRMQRPGEAYRLLVEQGIREGAFDTEYPEQFGELVVLVGQAVNSSIARVLLGETGGGTPGEVLKPKLRFYEDVLERALGAESGSIRLAEPLYQYILKTSDDRVSEIGRGGKHDGRLHG